MPNIATWWCGDREAQRKVLANFDSMAIAGAFSNIICRASRPISKSCLSIFLPPLKRN